jgi:hypothetical protein
MIFGRDKKESVISTLTLFVCPSLYCIRKMNWLNFMFSLMFYVQQKKNHAKLKHKHICLRMKLNHTFSR